MIIDLDSMNDEKHLCEDGCGEYTKPGRRFIHGHSLKAGGFAIKGHTPWNKGTPQTEEAKRKMSEAKKGNRCSEETKRKISESNKGKFVSEETKRKISEVQKGRIPWNKGIPRTQEVKDAVSRANKGKRHIHTEETKKRISEFHKGKKFSDEHRANIKKSWTPERRERLSQKKKQEWQEGSFSKVRRASSSYEHKIAPLMEKLGFQNTLEENYWVNGKDRKRKVPDFYNKETKEIVELWGTYSHRRQILPEGQRHETEEEVIAWYAEAGWNCRIIWIEEEFDNYYNEILEKVKNNG